MTKKLRKLLALLLSVVMVFSLLGITAMADSYTLGKTFSSDDPNAQLPALADGLAWSDPTVSRGELNCTQAEHVHDKSTCPYEETEDADYDFTEGKYVYYKRGELTCTNYSFLHWHSDSCYEWVKCSPEEADYREWTNVRYKWTCGTAAHTHGDDCYAKVYTWTVVEASYDATIKVLYEGYNYGPYSSNVTVNGQSLVTDRSTSSVTTKLPAGTYPVTATYQYSGSIVYFGSGTLTVSKGGQNSVTIYISKVESSYIDHIDVGQDDQATHVTIPSSATVTVYYADGSNVTLKRTGTSTGGSGEAQWRFTGLKQNSYISNTADRSSTRVTGFSVSYVYNGHTYSYTVSDYSSLRQGVANCPGHNGLDIGVFGSADKDYYYYKVVYRYYTGTALDGTDDSASVIQQDTSSVTLTPDASRDYNSKTYTLSSESSVYTNVDLSASKNNASKFVTIYLDYNRNEAPRYDYTLTYIGNGGLLSDSSDSYIDSESVTGVTDTSKNITVDYNTFIRANYEFIGWNTEANGSGTAYDPGSSYALTADAPTGTLYAQWREVPKYDYTLIYDGNGGALADGSARYDDTESVTGVTDTSKDITVDENSFVRENYEFIGWNTEANGGGTAYDPGSSYSLNADAPAGTLYAQWREIKHGVSYEFVSGTAGKDLPQGVIDQTPVDDSEYSNGTSITAPTGFAPVDEKNAAGVVTGTWTFTGWDSASKTINGADIKFTGTWEYTAAKQYKITYKWKDGTDVPEDAVLPVDNNSYYAGEGVTLQPEPTSASTKYGDLQGKWEFVSPWDAGNLNGSASEGYTMPASEVTVIGEWRFTEDAKYSYTLNYDGNGGSYTSGGMTLTVFKDAESVDNVYDTSLIFNVDENMFTRPGYRFLGWAETSDGDVKYKSGDRIALPENGAYSKTLYAKWEQIVFDLTIEKESTGFSFHNGEALEFTITDGKDFSESFTLTYTTGRGWSSRTFDLPAGNYTITEVKPARTEYILHVYDANGTELRASRAGYAQVVTVADENVTAKFVNKYTSFVTPVEPTPTPTPTPSPSPTPSDEPTPTPSTPVNPTPTPKQDDTPTHTDGPNQRPDTPKTGDSTGSTLLWVLFIVSTLGLISLGAVTVIEKVRKNRS